MVLSATPLRPFEMPCAEDGPASSNDSNQALSLSASEDLMAVFSMIREDVESSGRSERSMEASVVEVDELVLSILCRFLARPSSEEKS